MKVAVTITVDIDPEAWALEYSIERSEVREDVKEHVKHLCHAALDGSDLLKH